MVQSRLESIWAEHRDFVRRLLIGLGRDVDLAEDLLQETYIRASDGFGGYRGGDARAWLAAIAKNAYFAHLRRHYVSREVGIDDLPLADSSSEMPEPDAMDVRNAVSALPASMRTALIMRHYGGYSYQEIARRVGCPVGTAKSRVSLALRRLRGALSPQWEDTRMRCDQITDRALMDYVLGKTTASEAGPIRAHMSGCERCREKAEQVGRVLRSLDANEQAYKISAILELEPDGGWVEYISISMLLPLDEPMETFEFGAGPVSTPTYVAVQGDVVEAKPTGETQEDGSKKYRAQLPKPIEPGTSMDVMFVNRPSEGANEVVTRLPDNTWRFGPGKLILTDDLAYSMVVRIPPHAELVKATPEPELVEKNGTAAVYWQGVLQANQPWECWAEYRLDS